MRVVLFEPDSECRRLLRGVLDGSREFHLVGEPTHWTECQRFLDDQAPELLFVRSSCAPRGGLLSLSAADFPVVVTLKAKHDPPVADAFTSIDLPSDPKALTEVFENIRIEIYRRKLGDLSTLLQRYLDFSRGLQRFLTSVRVDDGENAEVATEDVLFMAADGNYVRLHTGFEIHEIRDTMSAMSSKLDPSQFARVHRSFIVNRAHVTNIRRREGSAMAVLLSNGVEIPVGPNYRAEVDSFEPYTRISA
jgi:two-component system LytT family response regulator